MKPFSILVFFTFFHHCLIAQKNFEGKITYQVISPRRNSDLKQDTANMEGYFANQKIKLVVTDPWKMADEKYRAFLMNFEQGISYFFLSKEKKYEIENLAANGEFDLVKIPEDDKKLLGLQTTAFTTIDHNTGKATANSHRPVFWFADSLMFSFGKKYSSSVINRYVYDNKICIGMQAAYGETALSSYRFFFKAIDITPMQLNDSIFAIPADYKKIEAADYHSKTDSAISDTASRAEMEQAIKKMIAAGKSVVYKPGKNTKIAEQKKTSKKKNKTPLKTAAKKPD